MSPYKSKAQAARFHQLLKEGKIKESTVREFDAASKGLKLPERVAPKRLTGIDRLKAVRKAKVK